METLKRTFSENSREKLEVGNHICLEGTGHWHEGVVYFATIADIREDSVKVRYTDGSYKRFTKDDFAKVVMPALPQEVNITNEVIKETHDKLPSAPMQYTKMHKLHEEIQEAVKSGDFQQAAKLKQEYTKLATEQDKVKRLEEELMSAIARQDYQKAHEIQQELKKQDKPQAPAFGDKMRAAGKRALGGGVAGAAAMVLQVGTLMWMRTIMNYQYRNGGTFIGSYKTLMADGGVRRLYSGLAPALLQGPLSDLATPLRMQASWRCSNPARS